MDYRLKEDEKLSRGLRRIAERQAEGISQSLKPGAKQSGAVHAARTHIKKLRALARLIRKPLGGKIYADCTEILKGIAKSLGPLRDAHVRLRTLERLKKTHPRHLTGQPGFQKIITKAQGAESHANLRSTNWRKAEVARLLNMIEAWPLNHIRKKNLKKGLTHSRRRARAKFKAAKQMPSVGNLHAWRKAAKDLMHQMTVMERIDQTDVRQMAVLKKLGQILGDDHDLAMLEANAGGLRRPILKPIQKLIRKKRKSLQKAAFKLGRKLKKV